MKAKVYLSELHQDLIDGVTDIEKFRETGDPAAWVLCCDGLCCILDFSKFINPRDLVSVRENWTKWHIRKEKFGALLWNPDTNRVFELDDEAYKVLMTLQEGTGIEKARKLYNVNDSDIHKLLATISDSGDIRREQLK